MVEKLKLCRYCNVRDIDPSKTETYVLAPGHRYFHIDCYNKKNYSYDELKYDILARGTNEQWFGAAWDYLKKDVHGDFSYVKFKSQWNNILKNEGITAKGIFYAIRYAYEIKKVSPDEAQGGIGIVPYVYAESNEYWHNKNGKITVINEKIDEQISQMENRKTITIQPRNNSPKKKGIDLSDILALEENE